MATLTIRLPDDAHARPRKISLNRLMEELTTIALTEFDAESRFHARVARGSVAEVLGRKSSRREQHELGPRRH
jgi:hypothetical protein